MNWKRNGPPTTGPICSSCASGTCPWVCTRSTAGALDPQRPHGQDEVYLVVSGRASITVGMETTQVARGSVVYVPAGVAHKFHHITEDLRVMVVFSPPEA